MFVCVCVCVCVFCDSLCDGEQVFGRVDLDLNVAVVQLHQALADLHLLAEGVDELLPQLVHLRPALLGRVGLDLRYRGEPQGRTTGTKHRP